MTWKKLAGSILFVLVSSFWAVGQQPECMVVHTDKPFYASGETIWFKVYLLNDSSEAESRVLHIDLVSPQNEAIVQQKLLINNRSSCGSITLPLDSEEGYYLIRVYTLYNLSFKPVHISETILPVYQLEKEDILFSNYIKEDKAQLPGATGISIVVDKKIYKPRESLTISVQLTGSKEAGRKGNFSVSIVPLDVFNYENQAYEQQSKCADREHSRDQLNDPEQSLFLEGKLRDPKSKRNLTSGLISIYMDKTSRFIRASASDGKIKVPVPDYWGPEIFQIFNLDPYQPAVVEFVPDPPQKLTSPYYNSDQPARTPGVLKYLEMLKKRRKIIELFDLHKASGLNNAIGSARKPDVVYRTQDYKNIDSFEEFINEAINNVKVRTINDVKSVRLFNRELGARFTDHPWYIVDGYLTFDEKETLAIQYEDILEVRLFTKTSTIRTYFEPFMWRNGIMEIITRDVKYNRKLKKNLNVVEMEGFTLPRNFKNTLSSSKNKTTPDLRGVMYWSPNVLTNKKSEAQITIPLSDDTGKFAIVVMGTTDSGILVRGYTIFEIIQE